MEKEEPARESTESEADEMLPEYDLRGHGGVRGKYAHLFRQGYTIRVHHRDGTIETRRMEGSPKEREKK